MSMGRFQTSLVSIIFDALALQSTGLSFQVRIKYSHKKVDLIENLVAVIFFLDVIPV